QLLQREAGSISRTANFFRLGGHSLLAARMVAAISRHLGCQLGVAQVFKTPVLADLADIAERLPQTTANTVLQRQPADALIPLSYAQQRLWLVDQLEGSSAHYNMPFAYRLQGGLNIAALQAAFLQLVERHAILRTHIIKTAEGPLQRRFSAANYRTEVIDLRQDPAADAALAQLLQTYASQPFDLGADYLLRSGIIQLADASHVLAFTLHHIAADGWSVGLFQQHLSTLYQQNCQGENTLPDQTALQYADFAHWEQVWLTPERLQVQQQYWLTQLEGMPQLHSLPLDYNRPDKPAFAGSSCQRQLATADLQRFHALCQQHGASLYMGLQAALALLLARLSQQSDIVIGTPVANREQPELEQMLGFFANTLVMRLQCDNEMNFSQLLQHSRQVALDAYQHQQLPFDQLVAQLQKERSAAFAPLFQIMLVLHNQQHGTWQLPGLQLSEQEQLLSHSKFDLMLSVAEQANGLEIIWEYNSDIFASATIAAWADSLLHLLQQVTQHSTQLLPEIALLGNAQQQQLLQLAQGMPTDVTADIAALVRQQVRLRPDHIAVRMGAEQLTYRELEQGANRYAHWLTQQGVLQGDIVALCLDRSISQILAVLAVLNLGAVYLPLDAELPAERLAFILQDAQPALLLTEQRFSQNFRPDMAIQFLDDSAVQAQLAIEQSTPPQLSREIATTDLAYILYTSGTTGQPKGVCQTQGTLLHLVEAQKELGQAEVLNTLQFTPLTFDVSAQELVTAWATGSCLQLISSEQKNDLVQLAQLVQQLDIQRLFCPPAVFSLLAEQALSQQLPLPALQQVIVAGEALFITEPISLFMQQHANCQLWNHYGPTETHVVTVEHVSQLQVGQYAAIGLPVGQSHCLILDERQQLVPRGAVGELYVAGPGVARGYLNLPQLSAERFVRLDGHAGIFYKTGDLVRWRGDNKLQYFGRSDDQVKVRGFRVELSDVTVALNQLPQVEQACVICLPDAAQHQQLVAYLVLAAGTEWQTDSASNLRSQLKTLLPAYMIPAVLMPISALPLTANGKVDKRALPSPQFTQHSTDTVAAEGDIELQLQRLWAELLKLPPEQISVDSSFFALGGHSLLATRLLMLIQRALGIELALRTVFEHDSIRQLARVIGQRQPETALPALTVCTEEQQLVELSFAQERLWFMQQMSPQASQYNMPLAMRIRGPLQLTALQQALDTLLQRHQSLRTRYLEQDGQVWQQVMPGKTIALVLRDYTELAPDHAQAITHAIDQLAAKPFALDTDILLRAEVLSLGATDHVLLLCMHHIATDGASLGIFLQDLQQLYQAACQQQMLTLEPYQVQYRDYASWQRRNATVQLQQTQQYWRQQLQGIPAVHSLPLDRPRSAQHNYRGGVWSQVIPAAELRLLKQLARRYQVSDFMLLHAVFSVLLARLGNDSDVVIGTPLAQRNQPELSRLMGVFLNTLVLRLDLSANPSLVQLLQQVKAVQLDAHQHAAMPFEKLVEMLNPQRSLTHTPLFQIMLNYNNNEQQPFSLYQTEVEMLSLGEVQNKYDLTLYADDSSGELILNWVYDANLFEVSSIQLAATQFGYLLNQVQQAPETPVLSHSWGTSWPQPEAGQPLAASSIPALFSVIARQNAQRTALQHGDQKMSYAALEQLSNQWAAYLQQYYALSAGCRVAIAMPRDLQRVVAILAVVKCGAAYVPLSTELPAARVNYMAQAADVSLVLSSSALATAYQWPAQVPQLITDNADFIQAVTQCDTQMPDYSRITADSAAHVIFTSGSTGQPKGVAGTHVATLNRVLWMSAEYPFGQDEQCCHITSMAFTRAVWELWLPLLSGQTLHLIDRADVKEPAALFARLQQQQISRLVTAPSLLRSMLEYQQQKGLSLNALRYWFVSGEPLPASLASQAIADLAPAELINLYGSTEVMSDISYYNVSRRGTAASMYVPIGQAISNTQLLLLDQQQQPVADGAIGEIVVSGSNLALGYLAQPEQTAEKFIQTPVGRVYRTGDLGRFDWQGQLHCLGRMDDQIKIRGYRIELGEIEAQLLQDDDVRNAVAKVVGGAEDKQLIAYLLTDSTEQEQLIARLRQQLSQQLPDYMQPVYYHCMAQFALRPNGKVDRHQLPEVNWQQSRAYQAPQGDTEQRLATIWARLLRLEQVGRDDNFFRIGGHSLLATRLVNAIFAEFATELTVKTIFEANTVALLAIAIEQTQPAQQQAVLRALQHPDNKAVLSYAQQRMWFMHQLDGDSGNYNIPMSYQLRGALDYNCLQKVFSTIFARHATLRTRFIEQDGVPLQLLQPDADFVLAVTDLTSLPEVQRQQQQQQLALAEANTAFDLQHDLMLRVKLLKIADDEHFLLMTVHHIVADGWSMGLLAEEFVRLYDAFSQGMDNPLAALPVQYADFAVWQREWLAGDMLQQQVNFWRQALTGAPAVHNLPLDNARPVSQTYNGAWLDANLDLTTTEQLKQLAQQHDVTLFMLLQTAFAVLVSRLSNETDIVMGSPVANRRRDELNHLVGFFVNTLVLRNDFAADPTFSSALVQARQTHLNAQSNQDVPFELLVEQLNPQRSMSYSPLFQLMFVLHNNQQVEADSQQLDIEAQRSRAALAKFDLTLIATETDTGLQFNWEYNTDLFAGQSITRFSRCFMHLLHSIIDNPACAVSRLALASDVLVEQAPSALPAGIDSISQWIEQQVRRTPTATALIAGQQQYSYLELDQLSNQLARWLRQQGVSPADHVGVMLPRSAEVVLVFVALLKLGAVYTPLDAKAPVERLQQIIDNAGIKRLLTTAELQRPELSLPDISNVQRLSFSISQLQAFASGALDDVGHSAEQAAYLIHTSGSTGTPKGVLVPHRTLLALLAHQQQGAARLATAMPTLMFSSLQFDVSVQEMVTALTTGSALVLADEESRLDMPRLISLLQQHHIGRIFMPYAVLQVLAHAVLSSNSQLRDLQVLVTAGEQLRITPEIRQLFQQQPQAWLVNHYGPSETHVTTECVLSSPANDWPLLPPIGAAVAGTSICVLDQHQQPVPPGAVGELYLGGDCLAIGYVGAAELTAERFVQLQLNGRTARWYRSGDLVRLNHQGQYDYLGRADQQLKIRGFRVEPGEIEHCILSYPQISDATVLLQSSAHGKHLVAYFVSAAAEAVDPMLLQQHLAGKLPDYMWPKGWMQLSAIPLTGNGKVNKAALPAIVWHTEIEGEQAQSDTEIELAQLWQSLLPGAVVLRHSDFFALGGHSLLAMRLVTAVRTQFTVEFSIRQVFEAPVLSAMAQLITKGRHLSNHALSATTAVGDKVALSFSQQRLWFIDQLEQGSANYNVPARYQFDGELDVDALDQALQLLVARHHTLRTVFRDDGDGPYQQVLSDAEFSLSQLDLSALPEAEQQSALEQWLARDTATPFTLSSALMLRGCVIRLAPQRHILSLCLHHIACDGWSFGILERELAQSYNALASGQAVQLSALSVQYSDFARWQSEQLQGEAFMRLTQYWHKQLQGLPQVHNLPLDKPRPAVQRFRGSRVNLVLDAAMLNEVTQLAQQQQSSLFMLLHTAFALVLSRYSNETDIVIGTPVAGRTVKEVEPLIGFFVNTLVLRHQLDWQRSFTEQLSHSRDMVLNAFEHQELPFELLVEQLQPERSLSYSPVFQVLFTLQNNEQTDVEFSGLSVSGVAQSRDSAKFDLKLSAVEFDGELHLSFEYNTDLFLRQSIERLAGSYQQLLSQLVAQPQLSLAGYDLLTAQDRSLLSQWNATGHEFGPALVNTLLDEAMAAVPTALAVHSREGQLSYQQLTARVDQLAALLLKRGVVANDVVAICLEKSIDLVVSMLAVLRAGAAYLPVDVTYPDERLHYVLSDSGAVLVLGHQAMAQRLPEGVAQVALDTAEVQAELAGLTGLSAMSWPQVSAAQLAYVIYTSGSTGQPKGVAITHGNLSNYLQHAKAHYYDASLAGAILLSSFSFDGTIPNLYLPLLTGGCLYIADEGNLYRSAALHLSGSKRLYIKVTPTQMQALLAELEGPVSAAHSLMLGGEEFKTSLYQQMCEQMPAAKIFNHYGPTETTIGCSVNPLSEPPQGSSIAIGKPISNTRFYVLDSTQQLSPVGAIGELYVAGAGVAAGYLNRAEQTAERFSAEWGHAQTGSRMYRTGDLVRWLSDGSLLFLGRGDHQVKLRGYRIELGELEAALLQLDGVAQAVAAVKEDRAGSQVLVAYIVPATGCAGRVEVLQRQLVSALPQYLLPQHIIEVEQFALSVSGKVDRKALPLPELTAAEDYAAPQTPMEQALAQIWCQVLKLDKVSRQAQFFALGGHSLLAMRLIAAIRQQLALELPVRLVFEAPVLSEMAQRLSEAQGSTLGSIIPAEDYQQLQPVSYAQQRILFVSHLENAPALYNMPYCYALEGQLNLTLLHEAAVHIIERHHSLRTCFVETAQGQMQQLMSSDGFSLELTDLSMHSGEAQVEAANGWLKQASQYHFNLQQDVLCRLYVAKLADDKHLLLVLMHHIASDGWSMGLWLRELINAYRQRYAGHELAPAALAIQYSDYARWQRQQLAEQEFDRQLGYWQQQLAGAPQRHNLPTDKVRPAVQSLRGHFIGSEVSLDVLTQLQHIGQAHSATLFMTLQSAFAALLGSWSNEQDIVMGTVVANRTQQQTEALIGFFVNTLVLRTDLSDDPSFSELLQRNRGMHLAAQSNQDVPFELVVEALKPERSLAHSPLFQVLFVLQNNEQVALELPELAITPYQRDRQSSVKFDLTLTAITDVDGLYFSWGYCTDLFSERSIRIVADAFMQLLEQIAARPTQRLSQYTLSAPGQSKMLPAAPAERLEQGFAHWVERTPEQEALCYGEQRLSYRELDKRASRLAGYLAARGVKRQDKVAVVSDRSVELISALLALLKLGAVYVPVAANYPPARISYILQDAGVSHVLCQRSAQLQGVDCAAASTELSTLDDSGYHWSADTAETGGHADELAYLIYTSGTTGKPKGVAVSHQAIMRLLRHNQSLFGFMPGSRSAQLLSMAFDGAVFEIWGPLVNGGALVLYPDSFIDASALGELINREQISTALMTPALFEQWVKQGEGIANNALRHVLVGGDVFPNQAAAVLYQHNSQVQLVNAYGPTENSVMTTCYAVPRGFDVTQRLPIGQAVWGTGLSVRNRAGAVLPAGFIGELCISGCGLAQGYHNNAEADTAFMHDVDSDERYYRSGDLVRQREDGEYVFYGRLDEQIKFRGFRIELEEISRVLMAHPAVSDAVVLVVGQKQEEQQLVAYLVLADERAVSAVFAAAAGQLPAYMMPSRYAVLTELPLTANGKLDKKALQGLSTEAVQSNDYIPPATETEQQLAALWCEVLQLQQVSTNSDFFALGGHSLLAMRLVTELNSRMGLELSVRVLFEYSNMQKLAVYIDEHATPVVESGWL
ncbi:MAG: hypothetical protein CVV11_06960, partial [Gammaproteobacteria bacterium HGW-Gammaproteobacteria-15]